MSLQENYANTACTNNLAGFPSNKKGETDGND
jgi:hypothetical protein